MDAILLATQNPQTEDTVRRTIASNSRLHVAKTPNRLWENLKEIACDCLFIDLGELDTLAAALDAQNPPQTLMDRIKRLRPSMGIVIIAPNADVRKAVAYMKHGASNYITEPVDADEIRLVMDEIARD